VTGLLGQHIIDDVVLVTVVDENRTGSTKDRGPVVDEDICIRARFHACLAAMRDDEERTMLCIVRVTKSSQSIVRRCLVV